MSSDSYSRLPALFFCFVEVVLIVLYGVFVEWGPHTAFKTHETEDAATTEMIQTTYPIFQDVHVMIFVGFGFLMTYLRKHSWSSVGFNFLIAVLAFQLQILTSNLWKRIFEQVSWDEKIHLESVSLVEADFAAGAVLITFGGLLGKVSAFQMLFLAIIEVFVYSFNEILLYHKLKLQDVGGSLVIHTFGAYFGLAVAWVMSDRKKAKDHPDNASSYTSNLFSIFGTLFLWMYWPSFNSALETENGALRTQISTLFALIGSALMTFVLSAHYKNGKFHMEDILNATLAGGVAVGACANLIQNPFAGFVVGMVAGAVSTWGFETLSGVLQRKIGLYDTAGIHNLHGMPGLLGGIISSIFVAAMTDETLGESVEGKFGRGAHKQGGMQIAATFISLGIAIIAGLVTGCLLKLKWFNPPREYFNDNQFWEGVDEEAPEVQHIPTNKTAPGDIQMTENYERIITDKGIPDGVTGRIMSDAKLPEAKANLISNEVDSPQKVSPHTGKPLKDE